MVIFKSAKDAFDHFRVATQPIQSGPHLSWQVTVKYSQLHYFNN